MGRPDPIPDHTTFSRRGGGLKVLPQRIDRNEPLHLLIHSTGVKIAVVPVVWTGSGKNKLRLVAG
jgi:hypothetical protein